MTMTPETMRSLEVLRTTRRREGADRVTAAAEVEQNSAGREIGRINYRRSEDTPTSAAS